MKNLRWLALLIIAVTLASCAQLPTGFSDHEILYWQAPVLLPGVSPDMRRPGYWISRLADPDTPVMTPDQIKKFEQELEERKAIISLPLKDSQPITPPLAEQLDQSWKGLDKIALHDQEGKLPDQAWRNGVKANLNREALGQEPVRYAVATAWCEQRCFPASDKLTVTPLDGDFDDSQLSAYDIGTPFALCHQSADGQWFWTRTRLSDGWAQVSNLALCDEKTLVDWQNRPSLVVTAVKADLWLDTGGRTWGGWWRMGTKLPLEADEGRFWRVTLPVRKADGTLGFRSAWVAKESAVPGGLPCTPRNIINQAFLFLDRSYGWGDMYGEQDCSRFLNEVFGSVGILIPRNSLNQSRAGVTVASFTRPDPAQAKLQAVVGSVPGRTLIRLDGHIMLYLGQVGGKPYAIHTMWAYKQLDSRGEILRSVNRTTVSTLDLGEGTVRGSFIDRILDIRDMGEESPR